MNAPEELVAQLARLLFDAQELQLIGRGQLADACRQAAHKGGSQGTLHYHVKAKQVEYCAAGAEGRVQLQFLAEWAASRMTAGAAGELDRRYAVYVRTATVRYTLARSDPAYQEDPEGMHAKADAATAASRALSRAAEACMADPDPEEEEDCALFPLVPPGGAW